MKSRSMLFQGTGDFANFVVTRQNAAFACVVCLGAPSSAMFTKDRSLCYDPKLA